MKLSDYIAVALISSAEESLHQGKAPEVYLSLAQARSRARDLFDSPYPGPELDQIEAALEQLLANGLVEPFRTPHAATRYRFLWEMVADLSERVVAEDPAFSGALWAFRNLGVAWLKESYQAALKDKEALEIVPPDARGAIPASDRYVTIGDNEQAEVDTYLRELSDRIRADNEAPSDAREIALSEIAAFEATIAQARVSAELIERFVRRILAWITKAFSKAVIGVVAEKLVEALLKLL